MLGKTVCLSLSWLLFTVSLCIWYLSKVFMWVLLCWKCRTCMISLMGPKGCWCSARCEVKPEDWWSCLKARRCSR